MFLPQDPTRYKIADHISGISFNDAGLAEIEVNGRMVCIARQGQQLFACAQKCPHAGALLVEGRFDALGNLVCPLHKYKFSLKNGRNVSGEGYHLKTYPVEISEKGVFIHIT